MTKTTETKGRVFDITLEDESGAWSGGVSIKLLPRAMRLNLAKDLEIEGEKPIDQAIRLSKLLTDNITAINLVHIKSGVSMTNLEDLEYYEEGNDLIAMLMPLIVNGPPLGNVLRLSSSEPPSVPSTVEE